MKQPIGAVPYLAPIPIVLVGAVVDGRPNFATVGDCAVLGLHPALLVVSLHADHYTTRGVLAHRAFSVNVPTEAMLERVDAFGMTSGRDVDKSRLLDSTPGPHTGAPLATPCPISLECRVHTVVEVGPRRIFVAHVVEAHVEEAYLTAADGQTDVAPLTALRPILYGLDGAYYGVGGRLGTSYEVGRALSRVRDP